MLIDWQTVMERSASSLALERITSAGYEPFRRTGSMMNTSRSSRASDTSGSTFSVGSDGLIFSSLVQDNNSVDSETEDGLLESMETVTESCSLSLSLCL